MSKDFEKYWTKAYPNAEAYFAQFGDTIKTEVVKDMCRNFAYDAYKSGRKVTK